MRHLILFVLLFSLGSYFAIGQEFDSIIRIESEWRTPSGNFLTMQTADGFFENGDKDALQEPLLPGKILRVETVHDLYSYYDYAEGEETKDDFQEEQDDFLLEVEYGLYAYERGLKFQICSLTDSLLVLHPINQKAVQFSAIMQRVYLESEMETVAADAKSYFRELNAAGKGKKRADVISKWKNNGFYADTLRLINALLNTEPIKLDSLVFATSEKNYLNNEKGEGSITYRDLVISGDGDYRYRVVYDIVPKDDPRNSSFKRDETKVREVFPGEKSGNAETIQFLPPVIEEEYDTDPIPQEPEESTLRILRNQLNEPVGIPSGLDYFTEGNLDSDQHESLQFELDRVHLSTFELPPYEEIWRTWENETTQKLIIYYNNGMKRTFFIPDNMQPMALSGILMLCYQMTGVQRSPSKKGYTSSPYFPHSFATSPVR